MIMSTKTNKSDEFCLIDEAGNDIGDLGLHAFILNDPELLTRLAYEDAERERKRIEAVGPALSQEDDEDFSDLGDIQALVRESDLAKEFNEALHPRDEQGRFTDGGGSSDQPAKQLTGNLPNYHAAPASGAEELFHRTYDSSVTPEDVINAVPGAREALAAATELENTSAANDTKQLHTIDNSTDPIKVGTYTPERAALHEQIMDKYFSPDNRARATPPWGQKPTFTVLGGRGGSGKSWFTGKELGPGEFAGNPDSPVDAHHAITINSDDVKSMLPEYKGWNASAVHNESSDIAVKIHDYASRMGVNVIWDGTLRHAGAVEQLTKMYESRGYQMEGHYMHAAPQVAAVRALNRFLTNGRLVDPPYVLSSVTNEKNFDALRPMFKHWTVYDSNAGGKPHRVSSGV